MKSPFTYHHSGYKVEKLADLPFYTEGPATNDKGELFVTTLEGGIIYQLAHTGLLKPWGYSRCPNGQVISSHGDHLVCDSKLGAVRRFDVQGNHREDLVLATCCNFSIASPNDLVLDRKGGFYFTNSVRETGAVFYCRQDGSHCVVAQNLDYPNGVVLSDDEKFLFVAESYKNRILRVSLQEPGRADGPTEVFALLPTNRAHGHNLPDGLAIDKKGNLYVAHYGMQAIQVLSPQGRLLVSIDTGLPLTSNVIFCDQETLIVTGGYREPGPGAVIRIRILQKRAGFPLAKVVLTV